jgi:hypothetical protein
VRDAAGLEFLRVLSTYTDAEDGRPPERVEVDVILPATVGWRRARR